MIVKTRHIGAALIILAAGIASAQDTASNPVVKERIDLMGVIRVNTGTLGDMASGKAPFDAARAETAKAALAEAAAQIPARFEPQETDPVSEARPEIWTNWDDFVAKAQMLQTAAEGIDTGSLDGVKAGMGAVGGVCRECHTPYRM
ncbi:c-type cytochrome [Frigidibacter oleivorans]|uniref:c-type cytochrome n=1 Tax=Frigidibacter oleivorans TaxID=2487129 RepID=UPI000F8C3CCC|nr:cytochrome c [Frigidibacter oleivorans]